MNINNLSFKMFRKLKLKGIIYIQKACSQGTFGKECNATCGYCLDMDDCEHINGTCLKGCASGFMEPLCKTSK